CLPLCARIVLTVSAVVIVVTTFCCAPCQCFLVRVSFFVFRRPSRPTLFPYTTLFRSSSVFKPGEELSKISFLTLRGYFSAKERADRKSTRLNSSHVKISYAVFCLKKKKQVSGLDGGMQSVGNRRDDCTGKHCVRYARR